MWLSKQEVNNNGTDSLRTQRQLRQALAINRVFHFVFRYFSGLLYKSSEPLIVINSVTSISVCVYGSIKRDRPMNAVQTLNESNSYQNSKGGDPLKRNLSIIY